ncbi:MAG: hypothetical protein IJ056_01690 [Acidaminococcaceae bacterium]|nr:hypothetical protein [Acidaminococcaceae bacterium]MBQ9634635.1 hypothetical protein [Acidaminococcaceae bacterium]MBQ9698827.1 hypothetical protein [Acidaminococcaceae bacterium]
MKTLDLVEQYGGIDALIAKVEDCVNEPGGGEIWEYDEIEVFLYALEDYKRLKEQRHSVTKKDDDGWSELPKIGDRHEMGG